MQSADQRINYWVTFTETGFRSSPMTLGYHDIYVRYKPHL